MDPTQQPSRPLPPASVVELLLRARALCGHSVGAVAAAAHVDLPAPEAAAKGFVGQLAEYVLGADVDAGERPDFVGLGVELKTVPVAAKADGDGTLWLVPQESTFICSVSAERVAAVPWQQSRLRTRLGAVLLLPVTAARLAPLAARQFHRPVLWRPSEADWQGLRADWEDLLGAIDAGRGMALRAHEGTLLQVRPKAAHSGVRTLGQLPDGIGEVLPQGFYLRASFVGEVLARKDCC